MGENVRFVAPEELFLVLSWCCPQLKGGRGREGGESLEEMGVENSSYTEAHILFFFSVPSSSSFLSENVFKDRERRLGG